MLPAKINTKLSLRLEELNLARADICKIIEINYETSLQQDRILHTSLPQITVVVTHTHKRSLGVVPELVYHQLVEYSETFGYPLP